MSILFILRLLVMLVLALLAWEAGGSISHWVSPTSVFMAKGYYRIIVTFLGAVIGFVSAPYLTVVPYRAIRKRIHEVSARALIMGVIGLVIGLIDRSNHAGRLTRPGPSVNVMSHFWVARLSVYTYYRGSRSDRTGAPPTGTLGAGLAEPDQDVDENDQDLLDRNGSSHGAGGKPRVDGRR